MITIRRSVHINAPVEQVFALIADPAAKSALNPTTSPIRVEVENGSHLKQGSHCHYRLQFKDMIIDYSADITAFEQNHLIESRTDSDPPVQVTEEIMAESDGTRLIQTETFQANEAILESFTPDTLKNRVLVIAYRLAMWLDNEVAQRYQSLQSHLLEEKLGADLDRWLSNIKYHLEHSSYSGNSARLMH